MRDDMVIDTGGGYYVRIDLVKAAFVAGYASAVFGTCAPDVEKAFWAWMKDSGEKEMTR